ncbi:hypothetical protein BN2476_500137 [Paraburkholderia piptadeniae]|uniref:Uncharacterized protein n=1 Tax=Paraburkholderia piptadeniae TaxID=1701573 RepID=A0A1N7SFU1_9BURK|nr:hypothetical protein BN2476_500137 [Paraburkholderia piptadeniae]
MPSRLRLGPFRTSTDAKLMTDRSTKLTLRAENTNRLHDVVPRREPKFAPVSGVRLLGFLLNLYDLVSFKFDRTNRYFSCISREAGNE